MGRTGVTYSGAQLRADSLLSRECEVCPEHSPWESLLTSTRPWALRVAQAGLCIFPVAAPGLLTSRVNVSLAIVGPVMLAKTLKQLVQLQACPVTVLTALKGVLVQAKPQKAQGRGWCHPCFPQSGCQLCVCSWHWGARLGLFTSPLKPVSVTGVENKQGSILKLPSPVLCRGSRRSGTSGVQLLQTQVLLVQRLPSNPGLLGGLQGCLRPSHWADPPTGQGREEPGLSAPGLGWGY